MYLKKKKVIKEHAGLRVVGRWRNSATGFKIRFDVELSKGYELI